MQMGNLGNENRPAEAVPWESRKGWGGEYREGTRVLSADWGQAKPVPLTPGPTWTCGGN